MNYPENKLSSNGIHINMITSNDSTIASIRHFGLAFLVLKWYYKIVQILQIEQTFDKIIIKTMQNTAFKGLQTLLRRVATIVE